MKAVTVAALLASMAVTTIVQAQTYEWEEALCSMKGDFDNKKYTTNQVENSYYVMNQLSDLNLESLSIPQSTAQLHQISYSDIDALNTEYAQVKNDVETLEIVPQAQTYKQDLLKTIEGEYITRKLVLMAYADPAAAIKQSPAMCKTYIEPLLQSENAIQNRWRQTIDDEIKEQVMDYANDPEFILSERDRVMQRYEEEKADNAYLNARSNLISYRFYNCVNSTVYHVEPEDVSAYTHKLSKSLFGKSFKQVCDE